MVNRYKTEKSLFEYENYRDYLRDLYNVSKRANSKFSIRFFTREMGFKSPNFFKLIMDGQRNLTLSGIEQFTRGLGLNKEESKFFRNLVFLNQAKSSQDRLQYAAELLKSNVFRKIKPLSLAQFNYFNQWYYVVIREWVALYGTVGCPDAPEEIARTLTPSISVSDVTKAFEELEKLHLISKNSSGRWIVTETQISTNNLTSPSLAQFHREMAKLAQESIDRHPRELRDLSFVTLALPSKKLNEVKEMIEKFRNDLVAMMENQQDRDVIYQLNFHLFPLCHPIKKKKDAV